MKRIEIDYCELDLKFRVISSSLMANGVEKWLLADINRIKERALRDIEELCQYVAMKVTKEAGINKMTFFIPEESDLAQDRAKSNPEKEATDSVN